MKKLIHVPEMIKKIIENKEYLTQEEEVAGKIEWLVVDF